jgi:hypothetical protein
VTSPSVVLSDRQRQTLARQLLAWARSEPRVRAGRISTSNAVEAGEVSRLVLDVWVDGGFSTATAVARTVNQRRRELERDLEIPEGSAVVVPHWDVTADGQS